MPSKHYFEIGKSTWNKKRSIKKVMIGPSEMDYYRAIENDIVFEYLLTWENAHPILGVL